MVKKVQKKNAKAATAVKKTAPSSKKTASKVKKVEKLSNGDSKNEHPEEEKPSIENNTGVEQETEAAGSPENVDTNENEVPQPRKRKVKKAESATSVKSAKKRRILLEVPKLSSVSGKVFVVGDNSVGQLGLGEDVEEKKRPALLDLPYPIVDFAAGGMHSVCLTTNGEIITFGCNDEGALGRLTTEEGSEHIPEKIDIPERIVKVTAGDSHSAALSESGQVYIWGNFRNNNGPIGLVQEDTKQVAPVRILNGITVVKIASGNDHLTCLSDEGIVYTCGNGEAGQLGRIVERAAVSGGRKGKEVFLTPDQVPLAKQGKSVIIDNIWTASFATFLRTQSDGSVYAFGLNNYNQLGVENQLTIWKPLRIKSFNNRTWSQISGGQHHSLALDNDGLVYSLGRKEYGRLGLGESCTDVSVPTKITSLEDKTCIDVSCGNCASFLLENNGSVYSWGMGSSYQLGHGTEDDQHSPKLIEGNFYKTWKAFKIASGGQHTLILAHPRNSSEESKSTE